MCVGNTPGCNNKHRNEPVAMPVKQLLLCFEVQHVVISYYLWRESSAITCRVAGRGNWTYPS